MKHPNTCGSSSEPELAEVLAKLSSASVMADGDSRDHAASPPSPRSGRNVLGADLLLCRARLSANCICSKTWATDRQNPTCSLGASPSFFLASVKIHCRFSEQNKSWGVFRLILDHCPRANCIKYPEQRQPSPFQKSVRFDLLIKHSHICIKAPERRRY